MSVTAAARPRRAGESAPEEGRLPVGTERRRGAARRWIAVPLAAAVAAGVVAAVAAAGTEPVYRATATMIVAPSSRVQSPGDELRALETLERRSVLATIAKLPSTARIRDDAAKALGLPRRELEAYSIRGSVQPYASLLTVEAVGPDAARVAALANAAAEATHDRARPIFSLFSARVLEPAAVPTKPIRPDLGRDASVAALLGLFVGALAVAAWSSLRGGAAGS
jgi:uncharacterized protein involved in exopolysaccharide biosynthesis